MSAETKKWILSGVKEIHLGYIKESFRRGAIIELDTEHGLLIISGRKFPETRDLAVLQNRTLMHPEAPWITPYTEESNQQIKDEISGLKASTPARKPRPGENMEIVQDDYDDHPLIDIRDTQVSKQTKIAKQNARLASHNREIGRKMEVIRGDETADERIERLDRLEELRGKGDMRSLSERVALKDRRVAMPIIHDDSLGIGVGRSEIPMNAGQHITTREEADAKAELQKGTANLRKQQIEMARKRAGIELPNSAIVNQYIPEELAASTEIVGEPGPMGDFKFDAVEQSSRETELQTENENLKAQNVELKSTQEAIMARLAALEVKPEAKTTVVKKAVKKAPKKTVKKTAKKVTKKTVKKATKVKRTPTAKKE